jgi:hypothetical protein
MLLNLIGSLVRIAAEGLPVIEEPASFVFTSHLLVNPQFVTQQSTRRYACD